MGSVPRSVYWSRWCRDWREVKAKLNCVRSPRVSKGKSPLLTSRTIGRKLRAYPLATASGSVRIKKASQLTRPNFMVRMRGLEPPRCHHHRLLRPARLPVPPHPRDSSNIRTRSSSVKTLPARRSRAERRGSVHGAVTFGRNERSGDDGDVEGRFVDR